MSLEEIYNSKYRFVSDGTWFRKGTEALLASSIFGFGCSPYDGNTEIPFETLILEKNNLSAIFSGITDERGEPEQDEELCGLDEFEIIKR